MTEKEKIIFGLYKDRPLCNTVVFRKKMQKYKDIDANKIYIKITNYQVDKYGCTIDDDKYINKLPIEEFKRVERNLRQKRRRNYESNSKKIN